MHWNILADKLAHDSFPKVPEEFLQWSYRKGLIFQHIWDTDADCLGLSEVDVDPLYQEFREVMSDNGYDDYFVPKPSNISGSAIFWKKDKFRCIEKNYVAFPGDSQFFMFCRLQKI